MKTVTATPVDNAASMEIRTRHGFPSLLGKAFGFTTFPTGSTASKTLNSEREF